MLSRAFLIGVSGTVLELLPSTVQGILSGFRSAEFLSHGFHSDLIMSALSSDAMALALPILAALPYTASFIDDVKSGFIKEYLPRTIVSRWAGAGIGDIHSLRLCRAAVPAHGGLPQAWGKCAELLWQSNGNCAHVLRLGGILVAYRADLRRPHEQQVYGICKEGKE